MTNKSYEDLQESKQKYFDQCNTFWGEAPNDNFPCKIFFLFYFSSPTDKASLPLPGNDPMVDGNNQRQVVLKPFGPSWSASWQKIWTMCRQRVLLSTSLLTLLTRSPCRSVQPERFQKILEYLSFYFILEGRDNSLKGMPEQWSSITYWDEYQDRSLSKSKSSTQLLTWPWRRRWRWRQESKCLLSPGKGVEPSFGIVFLETKILHRDDVNLFSPAWKGK